jgi:hypothetical protein
MLLGPDDFTNSTTVEAVLGFFKWLWRKIRGQP